MTQPVSPEDAFAGDLGVYVCFMCGVAPGHAETCPTRRTPPPSVLDEEVVAVLTECADDLEAEVRNRWGDDARLSHKLGRDLSPVVKARALLTRLKDRGTD